MKDRLVIYDGQCALCNNTVDFLKKADKQGVLQFMPFQLLDSGEKKLLENRGIKPEESVIFIKNGKLFTKSSAIIHIFIQIKGFWRVFGIFMMIPGILRDKIYDLIARKRYLWFGKAGQTSCNC
ncbi:MAG: DUF393 domain-containing protein [Bacteroidales bacterium]|nr:DUF393 domain-containing protein [Bacteroidales bacterium]